MNKYVIFEFVNGKSRAFTLSQDETNRVLAALDNQMKWLHIHDCRFCPDHVVSIVVQDIT